MKNVISQVFKRAIDEKKAEVVYIEECIQHVMCTLHQLKANVAPISHIPDTFQDTTGLEADLGSNAAPEAVETNEQRFEFHLTDFSQGTSCCEQYPAYTPEDLVLSSPPHSPTHSGDLTPDSVKCQQHHVVQRTLVIGNTSKYLVNRTESDHSDNATHKWMVYVRERPGEDDISEYVESVWFLLDPSYKPNDRVHVTSPPFQLVRRGWGEFPIRIQVHFRNPFNKAVDILHHLVLDFTKSGRQMFGSEKEVTIEIFESIQSAKSVEYLHASSIDPSSLSEPTMFTKAKFLCTFSIAHDHSYCSSSAPICVDAPRVISPSASCRGAYLTNHVTSYSEAVVRLLQKLAKQLPIVSRNGSGFHATSEDEFHSWSLAKQHACEWMRAVALKELVRPVLTSSAEDIPSTKGLVLWCRQHGHTPLMPVVSGTDFCKLCGFSKCTSCVDCHSVLQQSSMTSFMAFFGDHELVSPNALASLPCPVNEQERKPIILQWESNENSDQDTTWIMTLIAELGSDVESKWQSNESGLLCQLVATACKLWLNAILHEATKDNSVCPVHGVGRPVLPFQVYKAITNMHCCQFLDNSGLLLDKH